MRLFKTPPLPGPAPLMAGGVGCPDEPLPTTGAEAAPAGPRRLPPGRPMRGDETRRRLPGFFYPGGEGRRRWGAGSRPPEAEDRLGFAAFPQRRPRGGYPRWRPPPRATSGARDPPPPPPAPPRPGASSAPAQLARLPRGSAPRGTGGGGGGGGWGLPGRW